MDTSKLEDLLTDSTVHKEILGGFDGAYALGIAQVPKVGDPELVLLVDSDDPNRFKNVIVRDGERIRIKVETGFKPPVPLNG